jgi:predicted small metal-binding protein
MAKVIACGDVVPGCGVVLEGESVDALLERVAAHAARDHDLTEISPEVIEAVRAAIRER